MTAAVSYERTREHLEALGLQAALEALDSVLEAGQKQERTTVEMLDDLLTRERDTRFERRVATNLKLSGIAHARTLESFDFDAEVDVSKELIQELSSLRFLHQSENVLFLGPPGVGKSHLAIGLGLKAIEQGHRVYFITLHDLVERSRLARQRDRLHHLSNTVTRPDLLVLDEVGYLRWSPSFGQPGSAVKVDSMRLSMLPCATGSIPPSASCRVSDLSEAVPRCSTATRYRFPAGPGDRR